MLDYTDIFFCFLDLLIEVLLKVQGWSENEAKMFFPTNSLDLVVIKVYWWVVHFRTFARK